MYGGSSVGSIRKATSEVAGPGCGRMRAKWRAYGESRIDSLIWGFRDILVIICSSDYMYLQISESHSRFVDAFQKVKFKGTF